jgi:hypothetical protein
MKALICMQEKDYLWLKDLFPNTHPAMVPIANKPILEYLVDFAILNGCSDIRFVMEESGDETREYFADGSRWGVEISYSSGNAGDSLDKILDKNSDYCEDGPLFILNGLFFIHYDKKTTYSDWHSQSISAHVVQCQGGTILVCETRGQLKNISILTTEVDFSLSPLQSLNDIYDITLQILDAEQEHYVLPGYGAEKGVLLGRNVEIGKEVTLTAPVIIGDNVKIIGKAIIGPYAAIGSNVIIDDSTTVQQSIVMTRSYLGRNLIIRENVVSGHNLYSAREGEWMTMEDDILLSTIDTESVLPSGRNILSRLVALVLFIVFITPYYILRLLRKCGGRDNFAEKIYLKNSKGDTFTCQQAVSEKTTLVDKIYSALSLDKFKLLQEVIMGRLQLVGNRPILAVADNRSYARNFEYYRPGVFSYSEAEKTIAGTVEEEITERFFAANGSLLSDSRILCKILLNNFRTFSS